jgi:hypothetical protein
MTAMQEPTTPQATPHIQPPPMAVAPFRVRDIRSKSPALAALLSMMPGLGQVYVGYYQRGFVHAGVIASLITVLSSSLLEGLKPLFALFLAFFWLYNIVDAARRASLYNDALAGNAAIELPQDFKSPGIRGSIFGGSTLIVVGLVLLLHTRFNMSLDWIDEWWPAVPMIFGVYLVVRALMDRQAAAPDSRR